MSRRPALHLFEGYGAEIEYMLVERKSLDVLPVSDLLLRSREGRYVNEINNGPASWSNEFVLHVMEIKNRLPVASLSGVGRMFQDQVSQITDLLKQWDARLMPTGMHAWMDPSKETRFWDHRYRKIYQTYDRIFNCRSHGWANIQSLHLNLSFQGDEEFGRLHAAVRLILPLIPALAASSPFVEGRSTGYLDSRLLFYRNNQRAVPSIAGRIIPEPIFTRRSYENRILRKMYTDISRHDTEEVLQYEWLNSRGAIPRFERSAIEVRLPDTQECPYADIAVAAAISSVVKALAFSHTTDWQIQKSWEVGPLAAILDETVRSAESSVIRDPAYLKAFGYPEKKALAADLWRHLITGICGDHLIDPDISAPLRFILDHGTLSSRILKAAGQAPSSARLRGIYRELCDCLSKGRMFEG